MRPTAAVGIILIVLGVIALAYQGITYTHRKKIIDMGPIQASRRETRTIPLPPVVGIVSIVLGGGLVLAGNRR
jgi:hypothetical protein